MNNAAMANFTIPPPPVPPLTWMVAASWAWTITSSCPTIGKTRATQNSCAMDAKVARGPFQPFASVPGFSER